MDNGQLSSLRKAQALGARYAKQSESGNHYYAVTTLDPEAHCWRCWPNGECVEFGTVNPENLKDWLPIADVIYALTPTGG